MHGSWRLYLDECIDRRATEALIRQGVDAASSHTLAHNSESDAAQLAFAASENRTILTHDSDFLAESARLLAAGNHHAGVLLVPDKARSEVAAAGRPIFAGAVDAGGAARPGPLVTGSPG